MISCVTPRMQLSLFVLQLLPFPVLSYFIFSGSGFCLRVLFFVFMHLLSCHYVHCIHIRVRLMHSSIFPVVRFAFWRFVLLRWSFLAFFRVWGLNISGLDRHLPSGLGLLTVDRRSSFVPFGLRLILQRLIEGPKRPRVCCIPTPLYKWSKTHPNPLHPLGHAIVIERPR